MITRALKMAEEFDGLAALVERMEQRHLLKDEQLRFAESAMAIRFPTQRSPEWPRLSSSTAAGLRTSETISGPF